MVNSKRSRKKWLIAIPVFMLAIVALTIIWMRQDIHSVSDAELRSRYATGASQFIEIDGTPIHIRDEGAGPPLILLHGSYGSLRMWDDWTELLKKTHRVIRFDIPPIGLSGPDPEDRYGYPDAVKLLDAVIAHYDFDKVDLAGTSVGGVVAYRFAAEHPEKIGRLVLANVPLVTLGSEGEQAGTPWDLELAGYASRYLLDGYSPEFYQKAFLKHIFYDDSKVTDALVMEYADLANREENKPRGMIFAKNSRTGPKNDEILASIKTPTLILWCTENPILSLAHGRAGLATFRDTTPEFIEIPQCGHILPIEKGKETTPLVEKFLQTSVVDQ